MTNMVNGQLPESTNLVLAISMQLRSGRRLSSDGELKRPWWLFGGAGDAAEELLTPSHSLAAPGTRAAEGGGLRIDSSTAIALLLLVFVFFIKMSADTTDPTWTCGWTWLSTSDWTGAWVGSGMGAWRGAWAGAWTASALTLTSQEDAQKTLQAKPDARGKAEHEAKEKAAKAAKEKAAREAKQKAEAAAREVARKEAAAKEKAAQEARDKADKAAKDKAEKDAKEKAEREAKQKEKAAKEARDKADNAAKEKAEAEAKQKAQAAANREEERQIRTEGKPGASSGGATGGAAGAPSLTGTSSGSGTSAGGWKGIHVDKRLLSMWTRGASKSHEASNAQKAQTPTEPSRLARTEAREPTEDRRGALKASEPDHNSAGGPELRLQDLGRRFYFS